MKNKKRFFLILIICVLSSTKSECPILITILEGFLKSPSGSLSAAGGSVDLDYPGDKNLPIRTAITDANGFYRFDNVEPGTYNMYFNKGSFFDTAYNVVVEKEQTKRIDAVLNPEKNLGVFLGGRDKIQQIIADAGYGNFLDTLILQDFNNPNILMNYSVIFFNGGSSSALFNSNQQTNISNYIASGGNVYASDSAVLAFCNMLQPLGIDCDSLRFTGDPQTITADVTNSSLQQYLNKNSATIKYIAPRWFSIDSAAQSRVNIYTIGTYTTGLGMDTIRDRVLSFYYDLNLEQSGGKIIYTTFRNETNQTEADVISILKFYIFEL